VHAERLTKFYSVSQAKFQAALAGTYVVGDQMSGPR